MILMSKSDKTEIIWPYYPQPKQEKAWDLMAPFAAKTVNGYGAAKFGGKSWNIRSIANMHLMARPLHAAIFAREYDQLKDLHIEPIKTEMQDFIKLGKVKWNSNDKQFTYKETGSVLKFIQINRPADIRKHNGKGFDMVLVDEAQQFTDFELKYFPSLCRPSAIATNARSRIKKQIKIAGSDSEKKELKKLYEKYYYKPKVMMCFNWGDTGHNYLVSHFWEGCSHEKSEERTLDGFETEVVKDLKTGEKKVKYVEDPDDFAFIFADWRDNKIGYRENPEYIRSLKRLPEPYRTAYMDGDPYAFAGLKYQVVPYIHEVDLDELFLPYGGIVPDHWRLVGALDPGSADYCSFSVYAISPEGKKYQLTDYYEKEKRLEDHVDDIYEDIKNCRWLPKDKIVLPEYVIAGKDAFARQNRYSIMSHDITLSDIFWNRYGIKLVECINDRRKGAIAVGNALHYKVNEDTGDFETEPKLYFGCYYKTVGGEERQKISACPHTINELKSLVSDDRDVEDIKQGPGIPDHAFDKTKYFLLGALNPVTMKSEKRELAQHSDYGRIPKNQVYSDNEKSPSTLNDVFAGNRVPLTETI